MVHPMHPNRTSDGPSESELRSGVHRMHPIDPRIGWAFGCIRLSIRIGWLIGCIRHRKDICPNRLGHRMHPISDALLPDSDGLPICHPNRTYVRRYPNRMACRFLVHAASTLWHFLHAKLRPTHLVVTVQQSLDIQSSAGMHCRHTTLECTPKQVSKSCHVKHIEMQW